MVRNRMSTTTRPIETVKTTVTETETETDPHLEIALVEVEVGEGSKTLLPDTPICERMIRCLSTWRKITSNKTVLNWIEFGLPYEFDNQPPPPYKQVEYQPEARMSKVRDEELLRLESLGVNRRPSKRGNLFSHFQMAFSW